MTTLWLACSVHCSAIIRAKKVFNSSLISSSSYDPRKLWNSINKLLQRKPASQLLSTINFKSLPSMFASSFSDKVLKIHSALNSRVTNTTPHLTPNLIISQLISLSLVLLLKMKLSSFYLSHRTPSVTLILPYFSSETLPTCTSPDNN